MDYYFLNINHTYYDSFDNHCPRKHKHIDAQTRDVSAAEYWLEGQGKATIFFGMRTTAEIQQKTEDEIRKEKLHEAFEFIKVGNLSSSMQTNTRIITIQNGKVWIYRPCGDVVDEDPIYLHGKDKKPCLAQVNRPKAMPVTMTQGPFPISEVPYVLASMKSNQAFSRGTFKKIHPETYAGNVAAIPKVTGNWGTNFTVDPLQCLSSVELETLIAKLFEAKGCFVPAARGGTLEHVDLFATPVHETNLGSLRLKVAEGSIKRTYSLQIKLLALRGKQNHLSTTLQNWLKDEKHILITLDKEDNRENRHFGREWLREQIRENPKINEWLERSLDWLPAERRKRFDRQLNCRSS